MINRTHQIAVTTLLALTLLLPASRSLAADVPQWPASSVIYCLYPSIFSPQGNFAGVTAQLGRLKALGITDVWLMPITPMGKPINGHGTVDSPYCVHDYFAVNPSYGSAADFRTLVTKAHKLGFRVILDEVLNHTAWDNALITQHPEYYVHSDGNAKNSASIVQAFTYSDVAQLNYADAGLRAYMIRMLRFWVTQYGVDGFRFDTADDPDGPKRMIPADFWQELGRRLRQTKPNVLLLGECETPDLALKPFSLDYGWHMYGALKDASNGGSVPNVVETWRHQVDDFPPGMKHMSIQDDWDYPRDVNTFGGPQGALAAAVFDATDTGIPMIYNGMEVGNAASGTNPHAPINWASGDARFSKFYHALLALRRNNPALQQSTMTWLPNTAASQTLTYERTDANTEFLIEVNLSSAKATGTVQVPAGATWREVTLPGETTHVAPTQISLQPKEFAIFTRRRAAHLSGKRGLTHGSD